MGWNDHRLGTLQWRRAAPLALALGLSLPALALVRIESLVPFDAEWVLALAPVPDGDWAGTWSSGARTATAVRAEAFGAALELVVGLSLVVWASALVLSVLGSLRRVAAERPEWALKSALGASRRQLRSELRREGVITSVVAVAVGLLLAAAVLELGVRLRPAGILVARNAGASLLLGAPSVGLLGATVLALVVMPLFIVPAAPMLRRPVDGMAELRNEVFWLLAAAQVAGSIAIAATATVLSGAAPAPEIDARHYPHARDTLVLRVRLAAGADPAESWQEVRRAVERVPGVEVASVTSPGAILGLGTVDRTGATCASCRAGGLGLPVTFTAARHLAVDEGFFEVLGLRGRPSAGSGDIVLGEGVARRLFQSEESMGQRVWMRGAAPLSGRHGNVGLVVPMPAPPPAGPWPAALAGARSDAPAGVVLVPLADAAPRTADIVLRQTVARIDGVADGATLAIARVAPGAGVRIVGRLDRLLSGEARPLRWSALASAGLGTAAFLFALLGLVGVMAERVRSRRAEIGLRRALGASRPRILRIILADATRLALAGVLFGAALAASISRGLTGVFSGVGPLTAAELALLSLLAVAGAVVVSAGEALRAARMDPVAALRG